jgi:hypothetical protein
MHDGFERDGDGASELDLYFARLGDAQVARLLALVALPALSGPGPASKLVRSAIARLVRADAGELSGRAAQAVPAAVAAMAAPTPAPIARMRIYGRGTRSR